MDTVKKHIEWLPTVIIAFVLLSSLPFKFSGAAEPTHIFETVGLWLGLDFFRSYGAVIIGVVELIAGITVLIPKTRVYGAVLALGTMAGAIFFHLFTPLGVTVEWIEGGIPQSDGTLFYLAVLTFLSSVWIILRRKDELPIIGSQ